MQKRMCLQSFLQCLLIRGSVDQTAFLVTCCSSHSQATARACAEPEPEQLCKCVSRGR